MQNRRKSRIRGRAGIEVEQEKIRKRGRAGKERQQERRKKGTNEKWNIKGN